MCEVVSDDVGETFLLAIQTPMHLQGITTEYSLNPIFPYSVNLNSFHKISN